MMAGEKVQLVDWKEWMQRKAARETAPNSAHEARIPASRSLEPGAIRELSIRAPEMGPPPPRQPLQPPRPPE